MSINLNLVAKYTKIINDLYHEILQRSPDRKSLYYFTLMLIAKRMTADDIRQIIFGKEESRNIKSYTHYSIKFWNDLEAGIKYKNKLATDDENTGWMEDIPNRFKQFLPFKDVLIVGCGNGWIERRLFDLGIGLHFDAFDISEKYLEECEQKKGDREINYFISDINNLDNIQNGKYDAIFNFAILHHAEKLEDALKKLSKALNPSGLMFNQEYIGPAQNQYTDEHVKIMKNVMSHLPKQLQQKYLLRPPTLNFRVDPTEALHSNVIKETFEKYFDIVFQRDLNGGIDYQILWNNISKFEDKSDKEASKWLEYLFQKDLELTKSGKVPVLFWYGVGKPKKL